MTSKPIPKPNVPTSTFKVFTPKDAEAALGRNEVNRNLRLAMVTKYARDMSNGHWKLCTQPIVFDEKGNLIDGQHRLTAQIRADIDIRWLVIRMAPEGTQDTIDSGGVRSVSDILHFKGHSNSGLLAAVTRNVYRILNDSMASGGSISPSDILKTLEDHPDIQRSVEISSSKRGTTLIAPNVLGAAHWMIAQVNGYAAADTFIWRIQNLVNEREGSPVMALHRRCVEIKKPPYEHVAHRDFLAMVIKAWNFDSVNKTVVRIPVRRTGKYELPEVIKREESLAAAMEAAEIQEAEMEVIRADKA